MTALAFCVVAPVIVGPDNQCRVVDAGPVVSVVSHVHARESTDPSTSLSVPTRFTVVPARTYCAGPTLAVGAVFATSVRAMNPPVANLMSSSFRTITAEPVLMPNLNDPMLAAVYVNDSVAAAVVEPTGYTFTVTFVPFDRPCITYAVPGVSVPVLTTLTLPTLSKIAILLSVRKDSV